MSQYPQWPSPYQPPDPYAGAYGWDPSRELLAPARRASNLMLVMAALGLLCGLCFIVAGPLVPWDQAPPEQMRPLENLAEETNMSVRGLVIAFGLTVAVPGLVLAVCGFLVRGGGKGPIILSMIVVIGGLLLSAFNMVVMAGAARSSVGAGPDLCVAAVMMGVFALLLTWLIQALRASGRLQDAQRQYQAQYWQYLQQQQAYSWNAGQAQGGYPPPPPPGQPPADPLTPPPPPPPPPDEGRGQGQ